MKKILRVLAVAVFSIILVAGTAMAIPINGSISFGGNATIDFAIPSATQFTSFSSVITGNGSTGDYFGIPSAIPTTFTPFAFSATSVVPLWTLTTGGVTYSFDATSINVAQSSSPLLLSVWGDGIANISGGGFDPSPGEWSITTQGGQTTVTFSSYTAVPEPASMLLLGLGLLGIGLVSRKK